MDIKQNVIETAEFLDMKKAENVIVLDTSKQTPYSDYFIIAEAKVQIAIDSIQKMVMKHLRQKGFKLRNPSAKSGSGWILLDYSDFMIHLFTTETREFYNLESIWGENGVVYPE